MADLDLRSGDLTYGIDHLEHGQRRAGTGDRRPGPLVAGQTEPHRGHDVVDMDVVTNLLPVSIDLEGGPEADTPHQASDDAVLGLHAGPVHVGKANARAAQ